MTARVAGGRELRRTLRKAGLDMKQLTAVNRRAAETVVRAALPATPRRSGALAQSVRAGATQRAGIVRAGRKAMPYAGPIHWGWPARGIEPQPWLQNAAQATEPVWFQQYENEIKNLLRSVKGLK